MLAELQWRVNRLRCMTAAEIGHRALRSLALRAERWGIADAAIAPPPDLAQQSRPWIQAAPQIQAARYLAAAERIAAGRFDLFALRDAPLGSPPDWNRDPKTGIEAPLSFGKLLDYRDPQRVGDIKYLWELNRHPHLVTLGQAYSLSGDKRYADVIRRHLESWFAACPFRRGANWTSSLEAALRLINWAAAWQLLGPPLQSEFVHRWLGAVFQHAQFIRGNFSLHSSANNHLIGEAAGLFIAAVTWPCWPQARGWLAEAKAILEREALLQNAPDGVNREQAVSYQAFELDLLLACLLAGRENGVEFPAAFRSRIEAMLGFIASVMDAGGNVPMLGDADDALALALAPEGCRYRSLLAIGAILFRRGDFKAKARSLDDKSRWLFGKDADAAFAGLGRGRNALPVRRDFTHGGYYILGKRFETEDEIRLVADAGPLGYQSIAAHGHADALAFTLSVGGREFFVDPGTYAYHTQRPWRQYFRGTSAHNTLRVDGLDQSEPGGNFMWLRKANAQCTLWQPSDEGGVFEGRHDGYARLADPVTHGRRISVQNRRVIIDDALTMAGAHDVELFFHCSEHCRVDPIAGGYRIQHAQQNLQLTLPRREGATTRVYHGSEAPILGWISRRFDEKEPAPTIVWRARLAGPSVLRTEIDCSPL
jgi:hypothetical protein